MRSLFVPRRAVEARPEQIIATGASAGAYGMDPIDGDAGFRRAGRVRREVPEWTAERARTHALTAYRSNPMCQAVVDTIVAFAVGDRGVSPDCIDPQVREVVDEFWTDPRNRLGQIQEVSLRSQILMGEKLYELMQGASSGVVRFCPVDPMSIKRVELDRGNPLWPGWVILPPGEDGGEDRRWKVAAVDDKTELRDGQCMFWNPWRALDTDVRGVPFIMSILDWLDDYDQVLSNLVDRTAVARHIVFDVEIQGTDEDVAKWVAARGGTHIPESGTIEAHNQSVKWSPLSAQTGAMEDTQANSAVLTMVAAGPGLSRHWLADPEDANRATAMSMAEPVRRRVAGLQRVWLDQQTEMVRFPVDRAVASKRLPQTVKIMDPRTGRETEMPASMSVIVRGPEVAAADAQITAGVLLNLATGLEKLKANGLLSEEALQVAARKGWEDFMGIPFRAELATPEANPDDVATLAEETQAKESRRRPLALLGSGLASVR